MTEAEWLACASPVALLAYLEDDGSRRKSLLYAAAVCRRQPELLTEALWNWVGVIELLASGKTDDNLDLTQVIAENEASDLAVVGPPGTRAQYSAIADAVHITWLCNSVELDQDVPISSQELEAVRRANADLVRDIFGNPFRPATLDTSWLTSTVVALARGMYGSRDFGAMPILADALQDAGCDNAEVLNHCRGPGPYVRGCWLVDLVLGKA
jgi:hypothetical protein